MSNSRHLEINDDVRAEVDHIFWVQSQFPKLLIVYASVDLFCVRIHADLQAATPKNMHRRKTHIELTIHMTRTAAWMESTLGEASSLPNM